MELLSNATNFRRRTVKTVYGDTLRAANYMWSLIVLGTSRWLSGLCYSVPTITLLLVSAILLQAGGPDDLGERIILALASIVFVGCICTFQMCVCCGPLLPVQAFATGLFLKKPSVGRALMAVCLSSVSAIGTAYLYDYGVPEIRWYTDERPDWVHGLTPYRYLMAFSVQGVVLLLACAPPILVRLRRRNDRQQ